MEAEIIHAAGGWVDVRERTSIIIHAAGVRGEFHVIPAEAHESAGTRESRKRGLDNHLFPASSIPTPRQCPAYPECAELTNNINSINSLIGLRLKVRPACSQPVSRLERGEEGGQRSLSTTNYSVRRHDPLAGTLQRAAWRRIPAEGPPARLLLAGGEGRLRAGMSANC